MKMPQVCKGVTGVIEGVTSEIEGFKVLSHILQSHVTLTPRIVTFAYVKTKISQVRLKVSQSIRCHILDQMVLL